MTKILVLASLLVSQIAFAARPNLWEMTCAEATQAVQDRAAIEMNYGYSEEEGYLWERFVKSERQCFLNEYLERAVVRTSDVKYCFIGYICRMPEDR